MKNDRKIKIAKSFRSTPFNPYCPQTSTAKIILMGDWLKDAGFNEGNTVNVKVKHQKIIISLN